MTDEEKAINELFDFLSSWGARNDFRFVVPHDDDKNVDFININLKTNTIYIDELNIDKPLTEVG